MERGAGAMVMLLLFGCVEGEKDSGTVDDTADTTPIDDTGDTDPGTVPLAGECTDEVHWGQFIVDSNEDYAFVSGSAAAGVVPTTVLTNILTSGECTVWRRENPFCDPGCDPGYTCDLDGTCVEYPASQDLGVVTISGLSAAVSMDPVVPGYTYFDTSLDNPPWEVGSVLELHTEGGAFDPVTLHGVAPQSLEPDSLAWVLTEGEPLSLTWDVPPAGARTQVVVFLRVDQHGTTPASIECTFEDDGAGEVPTDVLDYLLGLGVTGFPAGGIMRRTADSAALGDGCIDLTASSSRLPVVSVSGYTPCTRDDDCPDGTTCNEELERCE